MRFALGLVIENDRTGTLIANLIGVALAAVLLVLMERRGITELRRQLPLNLLSLKMAALCSWLKM